MTIFYPDVSNRNSRLSIEPNTVAVCAKASEGSSIADPNYADFKAQSTRVNAFFFAYHWLWRQGLVDIKEQARFCCGIVGSTPLMIDMEVPGAPTVSDCLEFVTAFRAHGGVCMLVYLPRWYWQGNLGSPSLRPLLQAGLHLVSSNYTKYSDAGPGWDPYGGMTPVIWQYTSTQPYGGKDKVDFNAYRGTKDQLAALVSSPLPAGSVIPDE